MAAKTRKKAEEQLDALNAMRLSLERAIQHAAIRTALGDRYFRLVSIIEYGSRAQADIEADALSVCERNANCSSACEPR